MLLPTLCGLAHPGDVGLVSLRFLLGLRSTHTRTAVASAAAPLESAQSGRLSVFRRPISIVPIRN